MNTRIISCCALLACAVVASAASAQTTADAIYAGGPILTMDDAKPRVEAVAVKDGRILATGTLGEMKALGGKETRSVDLGGRTMIPGFVDAHGHVAMGGIQALGANMLPAPDGAVNSIAALQQTLRAWRDANRSAVDNVKLILGFGYDNAQLKELRHPTRQDLDAVSRDIPVIVIHQSGHLAALNSKALEVAGYSAATPDPDGGVIQRQDGSREPNGVLEEAAFFGAMPALFRNIGPEAFGTFIQAGADLWARYGYTTAEEGRSVPGTAKLLREVADRGGLKIDVETFPDVLVDRDFIKANVSRDYRNGFRVAGAKLTIDGSPQGFTAWRDRPYYAPVGNYPAGYVGYSAAKPEDVIAAVDWAFANGIQIITHANGEAASDLLIAAIRAATDKYGPAPRRPVLIHGQFEREDQVDSYKALGVFPSLFPMHTFYWGDWHRDHTVGPALADNISPTGWYQQRGMMFSSHHDAPVAFPDSMRVLSATVTRRTRSNDILGPAQRVLAATALKAMTLWAALSHFDEGDRGSIEKGKLADFVILSADPTAVDPETIASIEIQETIKKGVTVYAKSTKKTGLDWPADKLNTALHGMLQGMYVEGRLSRLPAQFRTAEFRRALVEEFDPCVAGLVIADALGLNAVGTPLASR
jgi:predicted amidohydrolase YtcJ